MWGKATSSAVLLTGAVLSYFRFFYGRTLSLRADVTLAVTGIPDPCGGRLYTAIVTVKNVGTVTIWHPQPSIEVRLPRGDQAEDHDSLPVTVDRVQRKVSAGKSSTSLIEPGESVPYCFHIRTAAVSWATTFMAAVSCDSGNVWSAYATVENVPAAKASCSDFE